MAALRQWAAPSLLLLGAFLLAYRVFGGFTSDDDLLVLRYAERFVAGDGLTWTDGERAHGLTSFLLFGFVAALHLFGAPSHAAMAVFSSLATLAAALCVLVASRREGFSRVVSAGLAGALVLFAPFSVWATAGIGGAAFAALAGWAVLLAVPSTREPRALVASRSRRVVLVVLLCVLQLVRPDAPLVVASLLVLVVVSAARGGPLRRAVLSLVPGVLVPVVVFGVLLAGVQLWYFGTPVPHVAGVKVSPDLSLVRVGVLYVLEFARGFFPLLLLVPALLFAALRRRDGSRDGALFAVLGPLFPAMVWVLYLVWVGGDWMPGNRHFALVLVLLVVSALRASALVARRRAAVSVLLAVSLVTGAVSMGAPAAMHRSHDERSWLEFNCAGADALRRLLAGLDPLLAAENVGCVPYVTGFRSLDMLGLADVHLSTMRPTGRPVTWDEWAAARLADADDPRLAGMYPPGHGNGDGAYVWGREPDLLATCDPVFPYGSGCFRSWREMRAGFDFASRYRPLTIEVDVAFEYVDRYGLGIPPVRGWTLWTAWVRHDAGPLGVRYAASGGRTVPASDATVVTVPSWLLTAPLVAPLVVGDDGSAFVAVGARAEVSVPPLVLSAGSWEVAGLPGDAAWDVSGPAGVSSCAARDGSRLLVAADGCSVGLVLRAGAAGRLEELVLTAS